MTADDAVQAALERVSRHRKSLKKHWALSVASGEDVWEERCSHDGQTWPCDAATLAAHIAELERELAQCRAELAAVHKVIDEPGEFFFFDDTPAAGSES